MKEGLPRAVGTARQAPLQRSGYGALWHTFRSGFPGDPPGLAPGMQRASSSPVPIRGRPSLAEFFEANIASVWRVLRGLGVAEVDLACACQEVFVAAHRQWTDAGGREQMRARLCGFCVRTALAYRRRPGGRRDLACEAHAAPAATGEVARATLYRILDGLDDDRRAAFVLHDIEELTLADVAAILGCSPPIARARLQAARGAVEGAVVQGSLPGERAPAVTRSGLLASRT